MTNRNDGSAFAVEAVRVAEANERLLVDAPGWRVSRVDEFSTEVGEMTFTNGTLALDVHWYAAAEYDGFVEDRSHGSSSVVATTFNGHPATRFRYGADSFTTIVDRRGANFLEIRGDGQSEQAYVDLVGTLKPASVDEWLSELPVSVVKPNDRLATIREMLTGVPVPDGLDLSEIAAKATASDRYQLGAAVTGAVVCTYLDRWFSAIDAGDEIAAQAASDALVSSHTWPILLEMEEPGDWPEVVWAYADATAGGPGIQTGGGPVPITREVVEGLGCER